MAEKKGKTTLSGLSKGGQSNAFLSFRFSPESEEIEQIVQQQETGESQGQSDSSAPPSPKPNSGDVSPLKEYLIKEKHKWAHKWDKKSLSLDLDLKGKIRTAIEDKKKSILSNFIPEESASAGAMSQSQSIPDNITSRANNTTAESSEDNSISSNSNSSSSSNNAASGSGHQGKFQRSSSKTRHNSSGNCSQATLEGDSASHSPERKLEQPEDVEEIGLEMTESHCGRLLEESLIVQLCEFYVPGEHLVEHYGGLPTLYQPSSLISGFRIIPIERSSDTDLQEDGSIAQPRTITPPPGDLSTAAPSPLDEESPSSQAVFWASGFPRDDLRVSVLLVDLLRDSLDNCLTKYWFAWAASNLLLPISGFWAAFSWFLLGVFATIILGWSIIAPKVKEPEIKKESAIDPTKTLPCGDVALLKEFKFPTKSQGWMTQMDGDYDVDNCTFRQTKLVFVRLDGYNLYLSYPHPRFRIPKRRLYNDPPIATEMIFVQHKVFSISGAQVAIVPDGLAQRRVWNKKYPIAITFSKYTVLTKIDPSPSSDVLLGVPLDIAAPTASEATGNGTTVNYNVNSAGISVNTQTDQNEVSRSNIKKEVTKEDCGSHTIFLFARSDREKDDWCRRFVAATRHGTEMFRDRQANDILSEYRDFMKRICPSLTPVHPSFDEYDSIDNSHLVDIGSSKFTPSSSRKSTPDKEKPSTASKDTSLYSSDIENILTIPQSPVFLNAFLGRLFMDFLKSPYWKTEMTKLIDKKLFYMRKPKFLEEIHVKTLDMGNVMPLIERASVPVLDSQGLWIDVDVNYEGNFCLSLETHIKLFNLGKSATAENSASATDDNQSGTSDNGRSTRRSEHIGTDSGNTNTNSNVPSTSKHPQPGSPERVIGNCVPPVRKYHVFDPEADDSGESSEDESDFDIQPITTPYVPDTDPNMVQMKSQNKLIKFAEGAAQRMMKTEYVKKMVNNLGATPLVLKVELKKCIGTLAINIPPPPNDRIWLGFRTNPEIQLDARPQFGERHFNLSQITEWLKKKILLEFQRVAVCPNMTDISISLMEFSLPK